MSYEQTFRQNNGGYEQLVDTLSGRLYVFSNYLMYCI